MSDFKAVFFQPSTPEAEFLGAILMTFTNNLRADVIQPVLKRHGLEDIQPDQWYPQQPVLNVLREIEQRHTFEELVAIGMKVMEFSPLPPTIHDIESALLFLNVGHHMTARNIHPEENIQVEKLSPTHFRVTSNAPSPAFLAYGTIWGFVRRFKVKGENPTVYLTRKEMPYIIEVKW